MRPVRAAPVVPGEPVRAARIDALRQELEQLRPSARGPAQARGRIASPSLAVYSARVQSEQAYHLVATRLDDGGTILVAKPPNLRGHIATRTVNITGGTEDQIIIPAYTEGSLLFIAEVIGGTGASVSGVFLEWLDLNVDGRYWLEDV